MFGEMSEDIKTQYGPAPVSEDSKQRMMSDLSSHMRGIKENADYAVVFAHLTQQIVPLTMAVMKERGGKHVAQLLSKRTGPSTESLPPELKELENREFFIQPLYTQGSEPSGYTIRVAFPDYTDDRPDKLLELAMLSMSLRHHTGSNFKAQQSRSYDESGKPVDVLTICEAEKDPSSHRQPASVIFHDIESAAAKLKELQAKGLSVRLPDKGRSGSEGTRELGG